MRLKNVLIIVTDIDKSKHFYHDLFGLEVVLDNNETVILTEGLVLQQKKIWQDFWKKKWNKKIYYIGTNEGLNILNKKQGI